MPGQFDIGVQPGMAMGAPAVASTGNFQYPSAGGTWLTPPGHLLLHDAGATATNPTSATTLLAGGAASNLWPAYVAAGDAVDVFACGTHNLVSSSTMTMTVLFGGTTVATIGPATATTALRPWWINLRFIMLSSTSVLPTGQAVLRGPSSASSFGVAVPAIGDIFVSDMIAVTVTAAPQTFDLKAVIATGNAASVITCKTVQVRHIPRDY